MRREDEDSRGTVLLKLISNVLLAIYKEFHVFRTSYRIPFIFPFLIFIFILYLVEFISRPEAPESILLYIKRINRYYE